MAIAVIRGEQKKRATDRKGGHHEISRENNHRDSTGERIVCENQGGRMEISAHASPRISSGTSSDWHGTGEIPCGMGAGAVHICLDVSPGREP